MKRLVVLLALFAAVGVAAQQKFTYDDILKGKFSARGVYGMTSMADGEHYMRTAGNVVLQYSYATGELTDTICDLSKIELKGRMSGFEFSSDEKKLLIKTDSKRLYRRSAYSHYWTYDLASGKLTELNPSDSVRYAVFSPDATKVAYVLHNNIYIKTLADGATTQVTFDGEFNHIINGLPDWVYEEEFSLSHALRWSPESDKIAYTRSDESKVKEFSFVRYSSGEVSGYTDVYTYKYPVAGERNSDVDLYVYTLATAQSEKIDAGEERDQYIPYFEWTPDNKLYFFVMNRLQNHLDVVLVDNGKQKVIYEENSDKYIDEVSPQTITFLDDSKRFIVRNETAAGFYHIYLYDVEKGFISPITEGDWEVTQLVHVDDDRVVYMSNEGSPYGNNMYSIKLNGKGKKRMTTDEGTYSVTASKGFKYYISSFNNAHTPNTVTLHSGDGKQIRVLEDNAELKKYVAEIALPCKEFITFTTPEGYEIYGYMKRPADFDPTKKYPVLFSQYSGPGSREVTDSWGISWEDVLVQNGYIVAGFDPRGTGGRGEEFKKLTYGKMGRLETQDQIYAAQYMASLSYVDADRIGIYGWSYGGFMALNCILKGSDVFKMAISVAPVTSWRYYDSVYTERYNGLPAENPEGYDEPSPIGYAANLKGKLLLVHGTGDDNVHVHNAHMMARKLVEAGKQFDQMIYTDDNHSMIPYGSMHIRKMMIDYCLENL